MTIRKVAPKTQRDDVQRIKHFAAILDRSPIPRASRTCAAISCIWPRPMPAWRGPYLFRHTHRVVIADNRLIALNDKGVTFKWKDDRIEGPARYKTMTLATEEFIRRFLIHVLPGGFHRIRHDGLFAKTAAADNIAHARQLLGVRKPQTGSAEAGRSAGTDTPAAQKRQNSQPPP